jgi:molecular chaperone GrpE
MVSFEDQDSKNFNEEKSENKIEKSDLDSCKSEMQQLKDSFLRLNADFENYKKRIVKEKATWITDCQANILSDLLPIVDDFDRAFLGYKKGENKDIDKWLEGFELIYKSFYKFLDKYEIKEITDFSIFNPEYHEAIAQVESEKHKSGDIVSVLQKGFILKDRVLRPARVTVAK